MQVITSLVFVCVLFAQQVRLILILRERCVLDMNHLVVPSWLTQFSQASLYSCTGSSTYFTKAITPNSGNAYRTDLNFNIPPNMRIIQEFEISSPSLFTGLFKFIDTITGIVYVPFQIDTDCSTVSIVEICEYTSYPLFFRGSQVCNGVAPFAMGFQSNNQKEFLIESLRIFIRPCHPSCLRCDLNNPNKCLTCPKGSPSASSYLCSCDPGELQLDGTCYVGTVCPNHFVNKSGVCEYNQNCSTFSSSGNCISCYSPYSLSRGICVKKCSQESTQKTVNSILVCEENSTSYAMTSIELLAAFYEDNFSSTYVTDKGFDVIPGSGVSIYFADTSYCNQVQLLLGVMSGRENSRISFPLISGISKANIYISFLYYFIDNDSISSNVDVRVYFNGAYVKIDTTNIGAGSQQCGSNKLDFVGRFSKSYQFPTTSAPPYSAQFDIYNYSITSAVLLYLGVREIFVLAFDCENNCKYCTIDECTECQSLYGFDTNKDCILCDKGYILNKYCLSCNFLCDTCTAGTSNDCLTCKTGISQKYNTNTCLPCDIGYYEISSGVCAQCDANCYQCQTNATTCFACTSDKYLKNGECIECKEEFSLILIGGTCFACDTSCKTCSDIASNNCKSCFNQTFLNSSTNTCDACPDLNCELCTNGGVCTQCQTPLKLKQNTCSACDPSTTAWYISGEDCLPCHASCGTCSSSSEFECLTCATSYYYFLEELRCIQCPNQDEYPESEANCNNCLVYCKPCNQLSLKQQYADTEYCQYCYCKTCEINLPTFLGICVASCLVPATGLIRETATNTCVCDPLLPKFIRINEQYSCSNGSPYGYFCPPKQGSECVQCSQNCERCDTRSTCGFCAENHFYWKGICQSSCFPSLQIIGNQSNRMCECPQNYSLKQRNASAIAKEYPNEQQQCLEELSLDHIEIINALSKPNQRENISDPITTNYFILTYNRQPTELEFSTFQFFIMENTLTKDKEYIIVRSLLEEGRTSILVEIKLTDSNLKITEISTVIESAHNKLSFKNAILVKESLATSSATQSLTGSMESMTSGLTNSDSEFLNQFITYLKKLQIVCALSNFVQLLTPIFFLNQSLPPIVKFGSLLGAAFIFEQVPSHQEVEFNSNSSARLLATSSTSSSGDTSKSGGNQLIPMLTSFGLTTNIFDSFIFVHVLVFSSVVIILFCYLGRKLFTGKQHTILVIEKLSNLVTQQLQSSITAIVAMVSICFWSGEGIFLASIYLAFYLIFYIQVIYLTFFKSAEYLGEKIPNFFIDINFKLKGAKWSFLLSVCKKHLAILSFFACYDYPIICCAFIACLFFGNALIYLYYRYFTHPMITIAKILQELAVCVLFVLLAILIQVYEEILESVTISDEILIKSTELSNVVLIFIGICLLTSVFFSVYRLIFGIKGFIEACQKYRSEKQKLIEESKLFDHITAVELEAGLSSMKLQNSFDQKQ